MSLMRALGPAIPRPKLAEALRAGFGAGLGLALASLALWSLSPGPADLLAHPLLIAPFGASAFLIFAVPNSPLAQPWAVVVGNTLSALAALLVLQTGLPALATAALAVTFAILAMAAARAMHPPGGAVALFTALAAPGSLGFALSPVFLGSAALVLAGIVWARVTGRVYPFRQPAPTPHGTADAAPERRHLPPPGALADLLSRLRLDANIGVEDLTRLITAAEAEAATRPLAGLTARHLMSRDLVTVAPETPLPELAASFHSHRFKTLPMVEGGAYRGLVSEDALVGISDPALTAVDLAHPAPAASPDTPAGELVQRLADGGEQALPIVEDGHLVGLVTRSDLIALLARPLSGDPNALGL
jgi:CBS domain-containing membrane protein